MKRLLSLMTAFMLMITPTHVTMAQNAGARMPVRPAGQGGNTETLTPTQGCPFFANTESAEELIQRTQNHLRRLQAEIEQNESGACRGVVNNITQAQSNFEALRQTALRGAYATDPGTINCSNYEFLYRQRYDLAVAIHNGTATTFSSNPYIQCGAESDFVACAQRRYIAELSEKAEQCRNQNQQNLNADTRANIERATQGIQALITNPDACGEAARESILQSAIQQGTSMATLSQGLGLPSLGISIVGSLLSSIAGAIFNRNSPERFLNKLEDDAARPGIQCLFYDLQRTVLKCEQPPTAPDPAGPNLQCDPAVQSLVEFQDFAAQLRQAASAEESADAKSQRYREISNRMQPHYPALLETAERLSADSSQPQNRIMGNRLKNLLEEYRQLQPNLNLPPVAGAQVEPITDANLENRLATFVDSFSGLGANAVNVPQVLQMYMDHRATNDRTFADSLNIIALRRGTASVASGAVSDEAQAINRDLSQREQSNQRLNTALSAMTATTRREFQRRIEKLKNDWDNFGSNTTNPEQKMALLNELFTLCMTTQGMSYFQGNTNVHLFSQARPHSSYQSACQMFECRDAQRQPTLFIPFNPEDSRYGRGTVADRFSQYQCALNRNFDQRMIQLRNNINTTGNPCGSVSSERAPAAR